MAENGRWESKQGDHEQGRDVTGRLRTVASAQNHPAVLGEKGRVGTRAQELFTPLLTARNPTSTDPRWHRRRREGPSGRACVAPAPPAAPVQPKKSPRLAPGISPGNVLFFLATLRGIWTFLTRD